MERTARIIATLSRLPEPPEVAAHLRTATTPPADGLGSVLSETSSGIASRIPHWIEVRADRAGSGGRFDLPEAALRALDEQLSGGLIYTLRSCAEGGAGPDDVTTRAALLAAAGGQGERWDLVDLEADRDLVPAVLDAVAPERRILSWHGPATDAETLVRRFDVMAATPARFYKLIPAAVQPGEELAPLLLLHELRERAGGAPREDVIAFASGPSGVWTRLLAPRLGAPVVFGAFPGDAPGAPGQPSTDRLVDDYGLPALPPVEALFGVIGRPVDHSLSPRLHNRAYRELAIPAFYLAFHAEHFGDFWLEVVESGLLDVLGFPLHGLSVTTPYKEAALAVAGVSSPRTAAIGAANTLVLRDGVWEAESTDPEGVALPIRALGLSLDGAEAAVVGAGGAGRAAVVGLKEAGARVTLFNRSEPRGRQAAAALGVPYVPLAELAASRPERFRAVVHATSLGRAARGESEPLPFDPELLAPDAVVVDLVYAEQETPLLAAVRASGRTAVDGREVLLSQALEQFRMMTGRELPLDLAHRALGVGASAPPPPGSAPAGGVS